MEPNLNLIIFEELQQQLYLIPQQFYNNRMRTTAINQITSYEIVPSGYFHFTTSTGQLYNIILDQAGSPNHYLEFQGNYDIEMIQLIQDLEDLNVEQAHIDAYLRRVMRLGNVVNDILELTPNSIHDLIHTIIRKWKPNAVDLEVTLSAEQIAQFNEQEQEAVDMINSRKLTNILLK